MSEAFVAQGRRIGEAELVQIRQWMTAHPNGSRRRLSQFLARQWEWRNARGQLKDMAARSLLVKLEARGLIDLPPRRQTPSNRMTDRRLPLQTFDPTPITDPLNDLRPLSLEEVSRDRTKRIQVAGALEQFHYLGFRGTVGENLQYRITDRSGRLLGCLLFGAPAWKCQVRDQWIGWSARQRERSLHLVANNTRFLILPFVRVAHLASFILGRVLRRLSADWEKKYGHPIALAETFVERARFAGTSYQAANWVNVGQTTGRSRQDRDHTLQVPVKDVYVYPLRRGFRKELGA